MSELMQYLELVDNSEFYRSDYPDIDVLRVGDTYYCVTTTMHFFPGCEILSSSDLIHWRHETYVYDVLDSTPGQRLEDGKGIYGKGMWAASLRHNNGLFYVCFVANDTGKTYLYKAEDIHGPWKKSYIEGFYHDCSLLFDDDGRNYIVYGNKTIHLTELNDSLTAKKEGGLDRVIVQDDNDCMLGYEGSTIIKKDGIYYVFFIHSLKERWRRVEACFYSESLEGEFAGGDIFDEDLGYKDSGIAQGCIVDTPDNKWYAMFFQDRGAVGRTPVLMPMRFEGIRPVIESPLRLDINAAKENRKIVFEDSFMQSEPDITWQWNHEPDLQNVRCGRSFGGLVLKSGCVSKSLLTARNTLTRRLIFPYCNVRVTVDAGSLKDGDYAGLAILFGSYTELAVCRWAGAYIAVLVDHAADSGIDDTHKEIVDVMELGSKSEVTLSMKVKFGGDVETAQFYVDGRKIGNEKKLFFALDHFAGCRAALCMHSSVESGGSAVFKDFVLDDN